MLLGPYQSHGGMRALHLRIPYDTLDKRNHTDQQQHRILYLQATIALAKACAHTLLEFAIIGTKRPAGRVRLISAA